MGPIVGMIGWGGACCHSAFRIVGRGREDNDPGWPSRWRGRGCQWQAGWQGPPGLENWDIMAGNKGAGPWRFGRPVIGGREGSARPVIGGCWLAMTGQRTGGWQRRDVHVPISVQTDRRMHSGLISTMLPAFPAGIGDSTYQKANPFEPKRLRKLSKENTNGGIVEV